MNFIRQIFCDHIIDIIHESQVKDGFHIVKSRIECTKCKKTFPQHPIESRCCYVEHIQTQLMYDYWINQMKEKHKVDLMQGVYHEI